MDIGVFDIVGPVMVGPSSSHTAGAVHLGQSARMLYGDLPREVTILLHGSFAATYRGHRTDIALVAGLLGMSSADPQIKDALEIAEDHSMNIHICKEDLGEVHPNTARFLFHDNTTLREITGCSTGGGSIEITSINGFMVKWTGKHPALFTSHLDSPGVIAKVTGSLAKAGINIATMQVIRKVRGADALLFVETDSVVPQQVVDEIRTIPDIYWVRHTNC
ncbi:MAG: L-serine ammonia-lyase, iron-sulfur-dependent subunit beta [Limnochordia bacterium]|jgi:L-serine dehydratase|nr:L-serine ammonia-lyase, iron-sulfur-dependent subunit beta [Limnochordia bacterium]MDD2630078.1 L-serine ammonia-lyase, iron-sulfur-dependent subunit beta [Limnochordia bacterium]MDD4517846.1 L-serine ammonia-lyase, iron-sulfur-dependent subunit beta [Limnochordia bacterium]